MAGGRLPNKFQLSWDRYQVAVCMHGMKQVYVLLVGDVYCKGDFSENSGLRSTHGMVLRCLPTCSGPSGPSLLTFFSLISLSTVLGSDFCVSGTRWLAILNYYLGMV